MAITAGTVVLFAVVAVAQGRPPIPGATGVIVPEGGGNGATAIIEGTRHILGALGSIGGKNEPTTDPLKALALGATVVVRYNANVAAASEATEGQPPLVTEGRVIELDRKTGVVVVRLADRTTERLRVESKERSSTPSADTTKEAGETISLSYVDANGDRVVILFRKAS